MNSARGWRSLPLSSKLATAVGAGLCLAVLCYGTRRRRGEKTTQHHGDRQFAGKTVLITGAAGDIGSATAEAFARKSARLVLVDLPATASRLEEKKKVLESAGAAGVHVIPADVTSSDAVKEVVRETVGMCGRVDCFFNNAGIQGEILPLHKQSVEMFRRTIDVNVMGVFHGLKYVAQAMVEAGVGGVIVNTASLAGVEGPPNMAAYAASKFAVIGMTKSAAKDLGPHGIRVCAIAPGLLEGKMWTSQVKGKALHRRKFDGEWRVLKVCMLSSSYHLYCA